MCGIAGVLDPAADGATLQALVDQMCAHMVHRGPDEAGLFASDGVAMGMRRLQVIDLESGSQPQYNEDGTVAVVHNGEIYNYRALRDRLGGQGHTLKTKSDTEVLVHLYEDLGPDLVSDLRGMFAFSLWDARRRRLVLARDALGIKPLYVARSGGRVAWASELKALACVPWVDRSVNLQALDAYLAHAYVPVPLSIVRGASKLPPATVEVTDPDRTTRRCYWHALPSPARARSDAEWLSALELELTRAVKAQLVADVPLGVFLSGGLDSSAIALAAARTSGGPIETFCAGFALIDYDERPTARRIAAQLGARHHEFELRPEDISIDLLAALAAQLDEPLGDDAAVPTYLLSRLARGSVTVALSGAGGDELFGGYPQYLGELAGELWDRLPNPARALARDFIAHLPDRDQERTVARKLRRFAAHADAPPALRHYHYMTQLSFGAALREGLWAPDALRSFEPVQSPVVERFAQASGTSPARAMVADLSTYLVDDVLTMTDRMSMWTSLEVRVPLLDQELVEFALAMPVHLKLGRGQTKSGLRTLLASHLPQDVVRRRKQGFAVPIAAWLHGDLRDRLSDLARAAGRREWFQASTVEKLLAEHAAGGVDHSRRIWQLAILELWLQSRRPPA